MFGKAAVLAMALVAVAAIAVACDDGGSGFGGNLSPQPIEGGLPPNFPDDFPMYRNLRIKRSTPLGQRYIIEADSGDSIQDVVDFYEEELTKGRWELLDSEDSTEPKSTNLTFTAPGFPVDGRLLVTEDVSDSERTIVAIAMPMESEDGD